MMGSYAGKAVEQSRAGEGDGFLVLLVLDKPSVSGNNLSFLFLPFFTMTTMSGQTKNFSSNLGPQHPAAYGVSRSVLEMIFDPFN